MYFFTPRETFKRDAELTKPFPLLDTPAHHVALLSRPQVPSTLSEEAEDDDEIPTISTAGAAGLAGLAAHPAFGM